MLCIILLLALKLGFEHTGLGKQFEVLGYNFLQRQLLRESVPVQVVDISDMPISETNIDGKIYEATSRDSLRKIIDAIAAQDAAAIGIDLDFSPDRGYVTPRDPDFFQYCLDRGGAYFSGKVGAH